MSSGTIAYFSMEIALEAGMPTYAGGLGALAGDTIRAAADLKLPLIAVSLLHRKGYFHQRLDPGGWQREEPVEWPVDDFLSEQSQRASVTIEGRTIHLRAWRYTVRGVSGFELPVYFLDADLPENSEADRTLTHYLYGGDARYRLAQEIILGIGGVRMLRALGYEEPARFHMNEGHAALLTLELLSEQARKAGRSAASVEDLEAVRQRCVFTTHTPVPAGHDKFPLDMVDRVLGHRPELQALKNVLCCDGQLNLTYLALNLSCYVNGVAKKHSEVSRLMFAGYAIDAITNGVHAATWTVPSLQQLFDRYLPGWRQDNFSLRYAGSIPLPQLWEAHRQAKRRLLGEVNRRTNQGMDMDVLTLGFARRATAYKRADLLFTDLERLKQMSQSVGPVQVVYAGKAHPQDHEGKELIRRVIQAGQALRPHVKVAYMENYDVELAKLITAGVDVWLNTPQPPLEASGTSGMKAALNGVPSLSILDGWWIEGHVEGVTGWAIDSGSPAGGDDRSRDARALYDKLEQVVIPQFYRDRERFQNVMRHAIALNGSFFNAHRMLHEYAIKAYFC
ncbi:alpha-glucan family phosphorylase [Fontivita pretiosa]|uniref:alpha-glucan family phosphorylase n=1 Tax=Fontivita pretiosa TaxID=2989684 RepID=UPI003D16FE92